MSKKLKIAFFDSDGYMASLAGYLCKKYQDVVETRLFTDWALLCAYVEKGEADMLLAEKNCGRDFLSYEKRVPQLICFSEKNEESKNESVAVIFKYRSAEEVARKIFALASENDSILYHQGNILKKTAKFIGGYSPFGGGITGFLFQRAERDAEDKQVLYINLEEFHGFDFLEKDKERDTIRQGMSEILFFLRQKKEKLALKIKSVIETTDGPDCIFAVDDYRDLHALTQEDMELFLQILSSQTGYEVIYFSVGFLNEATLFLLDQCDKIFMPEPKEQIQLSKDRAFRKNIIREGRERLLENRVLF